MGVVHLFGDRKVAEGESVSSREMQESNDNTTATVVELIVNQKIAKGVAPHAIYKQMEAMFTTHGVNFGCDKVRSDYKILTYLVQGMMDRAGGVSSDRCLMLDTLRHALAYEEPVNTHETNELFGDLLGRLD